MNLKRVKRKSPIVRILVIGFMLILVALPVLLFIATLPPGERIIKGILESQLTTQLHQRVTIDVFETNLLSRVQILGLRIADAREDHATPALEVGAVRVHYDLKPLLHRVADIRSVEIDSVRIHVQRDRQRRFNVALLDSATRSKKEVKAEDSTQSSWKVRLGTFALNGMHVDYSDRTVPATATIDGIRASVRNGGKEDSYDLFLDTGRGKLQYAKYPATDLNMRVRAGYSDAGIVLDSLLVRASDLVLRAGGILPAKERAPVKAHARLTGSPERLYGQLQKTLKLPDLSMNGDVAIDVHVAGTRRSPEAAVRMELPAVNVRHAGFSRSLITARVEAGLSRR